MSKLGIGIIRAFQFLILIFFTFAVFLYYGSILMIGLSVWFNLTEFFSFFGDFLSPIVSLAAFAGICYYISQLSGLVAAFLATGIELIRFGYNSISRFGALVNAAQAATPATNPSTENTAHP